MRAAIGKQLRQHMGVRTVRAFAARRGNGLESFRPAEAADEYTVRIGCHDDRHGVVASSEHRPSGTSPKRVDHLQISGTNENVDLMGAEPEIEQHTVTVLGA